VSLPSIHRKLDKAYSRMLAAKSQEWAHRWGDAFVVLVRARNAERTPDEIRQLERDRGLA